MKLKDFFGKVFHKKKAEAQESLTAEIQEKVRSETAEYDYLNRVALVVFMTSHDYGWEPKPFKKVILTNVKDCENKISVLSMAALWQGTGHYEWELLLAANFVMQVVEALQNGSNEADISQIFRCDLHASRGRVLSQKAIYNHIISFFDIEAENDEELRIAIRVE